MCNSVMMLFTTLLVVLTSSCYGKVKTTRHGARDEHGACALPKVKYNIQYPVALGNIEELHNLKFQPGLCGHVLSVKCDNRKLNVVINNSNLGGGLDLYGSSWDKLTNRRPPGVTSCSVRLSKRNAMSGASNVCYYKPGTGNKNPWYHNVGLLNTNGKIVKRAVIGKKVGVHRGNNPYFAFDGKVSGRDMVKFYFSDGSSKSVKLSECIHVNDEKLWS